MRLIDADALVAALPKVDIDKDSKISKVGAIADFICMVANQTTVEAVHVVRCKDCVYGKLSDLDKEGYICVYEEEAPFYKLPYDFCSDGKNR